MRWRPLGSARRCSTAGRFGVRTGGQAPSSRAQSHTVGIILLTAVIVILMGIFGVFFLGTVNDRANGTGPLVDAGVNATDERVSVTHGGGDAVAVDDLAITLRRGGETERYAFDDGAVARSATDDDPARFEATERFEWTHGLGAGEMTVLVIHEPSNGVLRQAYLDVAEESGTPTVASFAHDPDDPTPGETVTFDAGGSSGPGGVQSYEWEWDDRSDEESSPDATTTHSFSSPGEYDVTLTIEDAFGDTAVVTQTVTVVATVPPTIESTTLSDDDDLVTDGDSVNVTATVSDGTNDVDTVTADASAFDASEVTLTDGDGDGTYDATFEVGGSPVEGEATVTVEASDDAGNSVSADTDAVTVDTTPPQISTFSVTDESQDGNPLGFYVEQYLIEWSVTDSTSSVAESSVYVNRTDGNQATYDADTGDREYSNTRGWFEYDGRDHTITIVAVDEAGNRDCRTVTDTADGTDPPESAYASC